MGTIDNTAALIKAAREVELDSLDFESGTATFAIPNGSDWVAGKYFIIRENDALAAIEQQPTSVMGTIDGNGLRLCPFCGSEARYRRESYYPIRHYAKHTVSCTKCLAGSIIADTKEGVISDWNTRAPDSPKPPDSSGENEGQDEPVFSSDEWIVVRRFAKERDMTVGQILRQGFKVLQCQTPEARKLIAELPPLSLDTAERLLAGIDVDDVAKEIREESTKVPSLFSEITPWKDLLPSQKYPYVALAQAAIASIKRQLDKQGVK